MATAHSRLRRQEIEYPTSDGKPMAETEDHRDLMIDTIRTLQSHPPTGKRFYISGNLLMYYERGNKRKHVAPDVFAVEGLSTRRRKYYLVWEEGKSPNVVVELTSKSTKRADLKTKYELYRDVLKVNEYFLFDPFGDYLDPRLQGFRLARGDYEPIKPREGGALLSKVLGLILEPHGDGLRFRDPLTGELLPTPEEMRRQERQGRLKAEAEAEALRRENEALRRKLGGES